MMGILYPLTLGTNGSFGAVAHMMTIVGVVITVDGG